MLDQSEFQKSSQLSNKLTSRGAGPTSPTLGRTAEHILRHPLFLFSGSAWLHTSFHNDSQTPPDPATSFPVFSAGPASYATLSIVPRISLPLLPLEQTPAPSPNNLFPRSAPASPPSPLPVADFSQDSNRIQQGRHHQKPTGCRCGQGHDEPWPTLPRRIPPQE